jgi:hypothetical protein
VLVFSDLPVVGPVDCLSHDPKEVSAQLAQQLNLAGMVGRVVLFGAEIWSMIGSRISGLTSVLAALQ